MFSSERKHVFHLRSDCDDLLSYDSSPRISYIWFSYIHNFSWDSLRSLKWESLLTGYNGSWLWLMIFHKVSPIITISNKITDQQEGIALIFMKSFQLSGMEINLGKLMWILGLIRLRGRHCIKLRVFLDLVNCP